MNWGNGTMGAGLGVISASPEWEGKWWLGGGGGGGGIGCGGAGHAGVCGAHLPMAVSHT